MILAQFLTSATTHTENLRRGQHFMNELHRTVLDPFYNDGKLWSTVKFVTDNWMSER